MGAISQKRLFLCPYVDDLCPSEIGYHAHVTKLRKSKIGHHNNDDFFKKFSTDTGHYGSLFFVCTSFMTSCLWSVSTLMILG